MKKLIVIILLLLNSLWASSSIGSATAQFLEINLNARNMGMGNALTSLVNGASATLINPAGVVDFSGGENKTFDTYFSYVNWPADISFGSLNLACRVGFFGTLALNVTYANYGDEIRTTPDNPMGDGIYNMSSYALGVTFARYLTDKFSFGMTMKLVNEDYDGSAYGQLAYDIGTLYRTGYRNMNIGMSILHFSKEAQFSGKYVDYSDKVKMAEGKSSRFEAWPLPITFRTGVSMDALQANSYTLRLAFDMIHNNNSSEKYGLGTELNYLNKFFVRAGYQFGTDIEGLSAGLGTKIMGMTIDYAFNTMTYFGARHRFAIGYCF